MPQVSRFPLEKGVAKRVSEIFIRGLTRLKDSDEVVAFISDLMTPTERVMLAKRLTIALLLRKDYSYFWIKRILKVSQGTIASVQVQLKLSGKGYDRVINEILKEEKINKFLTKLEDKIVDSFPDSHKGSGVWREIKRKHKKERRDRVSF